MPRRILMLCGLLPALAFPSMAQASDASLIHALAPYKSTLTVDIIFLAEVNKVPTKAQAASIASHLSHVQSDMATVSRVARGQTPSTSGGRKAQSEVVQGLGYAYGAAGDGLAAVSAVRANNNSAAGRDIASEQSLVGKSIPDFELSGKALGLFQG